MAVKCGGKTAPCPAHCRMAAGIRFHVGSASNLLRFDVAGSLVPTTKRSIASMASDIYVRPQFFGGSGNYGSPLRGDYIHKDYNTTCWGM